MTYYDDISEGYEELHKEEQEKKIMLIKAFFEPKSHEKLLDVGCGTGLTTEPWQCIRYGIDPAKKLIERARQKDIIEYKIAPAENIPYPDGFFDHVVSITAIQNFFDIRKGLLEIKRVGKKSFVLSALKRSGKIDVIRQLINDMFEVKKEIEEEKDLIFFAS
ncbi:MAG: class I SAM-dependent methyltransferase [Candidatus Woesearchaeota archaeon]|nr:class I SAM-dependent methyltransferase [Candidatus Woesearchaeota archaeon]